MKIILLLLLPIQIFAVTPNVVKVLMLGDSLTAGFGIKKSKAYPSLVEQKFGTSNINIINAGSSGDTSFALLNRLDWTLSAVSPNIAFICIGGNDGLRGYPASVTERNIQTMIDKLTSNNISVLLAGITLPKNYSDSYISEFDAIFERLASKNSIPLLPFLLEGVAGVPTLNLVDKIHPNEAGHEIIAETVYQFFVSQNITEIQPIVSENITEMVTEPTEN